MSRPREFEHQKLPRGVVGVAVAVIADYDRRAAEIKRGALSEGLLLSYSRYNEIVDDALTCVEESARREMLSDIASGRGYDYSKLAPMLNRKSYYLRKKTAIYKVAIALKLF